MTELSVMMVEPKYGLNIGYVARTMMNFGIDKLIVTGLSELPEDAYKFSAHAKGIVKNAVLGNFDEEVAKFDLRMATTARPSASSKNVNRRAMTPEAAFSRARMFKRALLILGRDVSGLNNRELSACDYVISIPASRAYPTLNISHALAILLYMWKGAPASRRKSRIRTEERNAALEYAGAVADGVGLSEERKKRTLKLIKGITVDYITTEEDLVTLLGFLRRTRIALARGAEGRQANLFKTSDYRG